MRRGLVELELRDGLGTREVKGRGLIELRFGLGRTPGEGHPGRPMGQVEVKEDALDVEGRVMNEMIRISPPQSGQLSSVLVTCLLLSFLPLIGLVIGVIHYRLQLVAPFRRYVGRGRAFFGMVRRSLAPASVAGEDNPSRDFS